MRQFEPDSLKLPAIDFFDGSRTFFDLSAGALLSDTPAMSYKGCL
jgi:hypothetical protein